MLEKYLADLNFLVVGDVMLDRYFWGDVERISPEAPVPVFDLQKVSQNLGGAANVAANLKGLKVEVELAGLVGRDNEGEDLKALAQRQNIGVKALFPDETRPTTVKTRIIASAQQLLRIDTEQRHPLSQDKIVLFLQGIRNLFENKKLNGVILSDYAKGLLRSEVLCQEIIGLARAQGIPVMVDPKGLDWKRYQGATCITPNTKELFEVARAEGVYDQDISSICTHLCAKYQFDFMLVTMGPKGIYLHHPQYKQIFPAQAREVYDVSGAGDTVISTLTAFFSAGLPLPQVVTLANIAAGIVVGKVGTQPITLEEIESAVKNEFSSLFNITPAQKISGVSHGPS